MEASSVPPRRWTTRARRLAARAHGEVRARTDPKSLGGQVVLNSGWLIGERLLRMVLAFIVTIWVIRYLGDEDYGVLAYALSVTMLVDVVATMGMRSVVVRELVEDPEREPEILGSAVGARVLGAVVSAVLIIGIGWFVAAGSKSFPVLVVLSLSLPFSALGSLDLAFQAYLQSQYAVAARIGGLAFASVLRIVLLLLGAPLIAFAIASAVELTGIGLAFATMYAWKRGRLFALRFNPRRAWHLMTVSWPFFMSALAASIYLKVDQVMLHGFTTSSQVGQYAAAARLSEVWYFIPIAMASSLLPMLVIRRREDPAQYQKNLQHAYDINAWMAISLSVGITLFAVPGVAILYGGGFHDTAEILRIHTWAAPFIFMGTVLGRALIAEDRRKFELSRHASGALLNVLLNLVLIPRYEGIGAAVATVISYAFASYVACVFNERGRFHLRLMTRALVWPVRLARGRRSSGPPGGSEDRRPRRPEPGGAPSNHAHSGDDDLGSTRSTHPRSRAERRTRV
ncbi:MAG: flippase [Dehalococcoidia bacterium]|nr:flippase [Dehalococcoidia bacterium]